jgi:hypothetical protein
LVPCDDFPADPQSQSRPLGAFGGKKGFKDMGDRIGRDARTGIRNRQNDTSSSGIPIRAFAGTNDKPSFGSGHRVDRVPNEIAQYLPDLPVKTRNGPTCAVAPLNIHAGVRDPALIKWQSGVDEPGGGDGYWICGLPVKLECLIGDCRDTA